MTARTGRIIVYENNFVNSVLVAALDTWPKNPILPYDAYRRATYTHSVFTSFMRDCERSVAGYDYISNRVYNDSVVQNPLSIAQIPPIAVISSLLSNSLSIRDIDDIPKMRRDFDIIGRTAYYIGVAVEEISENTSYVNVNMKYAYNQTNKVQTVCGSLYLHRNVEKAVALIDAEEKAYLKAMNDKSPKSTIEYVDCVMELAKIIDVIDNIFILLARKHSIGRLHEIILRKIAEFKGDCKKSRMYEFGSVVASAIASREVRELLRKSMQRE